ncbi:MAG: NUDIX domain-containing protein [Acidimicrobiaceae bacterium]|nr:NUDIX domain-containing protein [Acidimicrobiaceae bacterium]
MALPPEATPAATVVPLRDAPAGLEVLMLRRDARGAFGGMWVFPGGKVDAGDLEPGALEGGVEVEMRAARRAAVREASEEARLTIAEGDLVPLSFWLPPAEAPRRFATWFFLASVPAGEVVVDRAEVHEHRWLRPEEAMAERDAGRIELVPPTFMTLWWLAAQPDLATAMATAGSRPPERFHTHMCQGREGIPAALWQGDAGYDDRDADRAGPRRRLWLDPKGWRVEVR